MASWKSEEQDHLCEMSAEDFPLTVRIGYLGTSSFGEVWKEDIQL